jgi:hypothetical protein
MIYHIMAANQPHHIHDMIRLLEAYAADIGVVPEEQIYILLAADNSNRELYQRLELPPERLTLLTDLRCKSSIFKRIGKDDLLILHGAFYRGLWFSLFRHPHVWKNTALLIWGGEIQVFERQNLLWQKPSAN